MKIMKQEPKQGSLRGRAGLSHWSKEGGLNCRKLPLDLEIEKALVAVDTRQLKSTLQFSRWSSKPLHIQYYTV